MQIPGWERRAQHGPGWHEQLRDAPATAVGGGIAMADTAIGGYSHGVPPSSAQGRLEATAGSNPLDGYFRQYVQQMRR
jgi:hypothetical protein